MNFLIQSADLSFSESISNPTLNFLVIAAAFYAHLTGSVLMKFSYKSHPPTENITLISEFATDLRPS